VGGLQAEASRGGAKQMSKRQRKVLLGPHPRIRIPDFDWPLVEKAYGYPLEEEVRTKIKEIIIDFLLMAHFELTVVPAADAEREIKRILSPADQLLRELSTAEEQLLRELSKEPLDAAGRIPAQQLLRAYGTGAGYAMHLLMAHFSDQALTYGAKEPNPLSAFSSSLAALVAACNRSLEELDDPSHTMEEGQAWRYFIQQLTAVLKKAGLPATARKDEAEPSEFVCLIRDLLLRELPDSLPRHFPRHTQSNQALALAIHRARVTKAKHRHS
jgi:hypothetical protein